MTGTGLDAEWRGVSRGTHTAMRSDEPIPSDVYFTSLDAYREPNRSRENRDAPEFAEQLQWIPRLSEFVGKPSKALENRPCGGECLGPEAVLPSL